MNSSRTWKSGEHCRFPGTYRCQVCYAAGQVTLKEFAANQVIPMCAVCPEKDATWRLMKAADRTAASA
ncbi:MAG TPA: hypothetical protein VFT43_00545 [Candidatus Polarisedimenticolia bacterium]|nr:hypothetical protein [Candidatus Polarisedimenticolia bacterium]